jgi:hypothetical protein
LIKKIYKKISSCKFFPIVGHQFPGSGTGSGSALGSESGSGSAIRKNAGSVSVSGYALNPCGSTTLDEYLDIENDPDPN